MRYFLNILAAFEAVESLGEGVKADEFCPGWWQRVPSSSPLKVLGDDMGHLDHIGCCFFLSNIFKFEMQLEHCISNLKISPQHAVWMFNSFHFLSSFIFPCFWLWSVKQRVQTCCNSVADQAGEESCGLQKNFFYIFLQTEDRHFYLWKISMSWKFQLSVWMLNGGKYLKSRGLSMRESWGGGRGGGKGGLGEGGLRTWLAALHPLLQLGILLTYSFHQNTANTLPFLDALAEGYNWLFLPHTNWSSSFSFVFLTWMYYLTFRTRIEGTL